MGWFRTQAQNGNPRSPEVEMDPIELFRIRCLREAEQRFAQGIEQMQYQQLTQKPDGSSGSFKTVEELRGNDLGVSGMEQPPGLGCGNLLQPPKTAKMDGVGWKPGSTSFGGGQGSEL